jgi:hypothetical protein
MMGKNKDTHKKIQLNIMSIPPILVRIFLIGVLALFLWGIYSSSRALDVSMDSIREALIQNTDIQEMEGCNNRKLLQFLNINYQNYDSYTYWKSTASLGVDEVLVVKVRDTSDLDDVKDAVESRVKSQEKVFESYGPDQMKLLGNAVIETRGKYLFYCVSNDATKYEEVFRDAVQ